MEVSRRRGLLALLVGVGGLLLKVSPLGRFRSFPASVARLRDGRDAKAIRVPSRRVEPDPHSVRRHA